MNIDDLKAEEAYERKWHRRQKLGRLEDRYAPRRHKWRVYKSTITGQWNITHHLDDNGRNSITWSRNTHAEALAYADEKARTREVVLPRLGAAAIEVLGSEGFIPYSPDSAEVIALSMLTYKELAALAEQEGAP